MKRTADRQKPEESLAEHLRGIDAPPKLSWPCGHLITPENTYQRSYKNRKWNACCRACKRRSWHSASKKYACTLNGRLTYNTYVASKRLKEIESG